MYITASSTISFQPTFKNRGFSSELTELKQDSGLLHPDYTDAIPAMYRRRMTEVLKMSIACARDCLEQSGLEQPDAIIVGTCMGCCNFTKRFLDKIISSEGGPISPTSFILSTHNTIAGQISLLLKNHNYNMTHTQNSLSFEQALIDGMLCIKEGSKNILAGGADEEEDALYNTNERLDTENILTAYGASFFLLSKEQPDSGFINLIDVGSFGLIENLTTKIKDFLASNAIAANDIDLVLYSSSNQKPVDELKELFNARKLFDFLKMSGVYFTNSAFAMHYGVDVLLYGKHPVTGENVKRVLICNNLIPENLGLILLDSEKA